MPIDPFLLRTQPSQPTINTHTVHNDELNEILRLRLTNDDLQKQINELNNANSKLVNANNNLKRASKAQTILMRSKRDKMRKMRNKLLELKEIVGDLPSSCTTPEKSALIVKHIKKVIQSSVSRHAKDSFRTETFFKLLSKMLLEDNIHNWKLRDTILVAFRRHMRKHVFTPFKILKEMDLAGGTANYESIEILRRVESQGKKYTHTLLPSTSSVQRLAADIEEFGRYKCPFRMIRNTVDQCEGFYFRAADIMREILRSGNLLESVAKIKNILISMSLDGATLNKNLNHTLCGLKFNDTRNPFGRLRNAVFPLVCVCGGETKLRVRGLFSRVIKEATEAALDVLVKKYGIKKVTLAFNSDMSCEWKIADCGGAAKNCIYPCTKCCWTSEELHTRYKSPKDCNWCRHMKHHFNPEWRCRHQLMCSSDNLKRMEQEMRDFERDNPTIDKDLAKLWDDSTIKVTGDPRLEPTPAQKATITSIHFDVARASRKSRSKYSSDITHDLQLRSMNIEGSLIARQLRLKVQLGREWMYRDAALCTQKHRAVNANTALVLMMSVLPCILHMEIRIGIKMLSMLLKEGLTNAKMKKLQWIPPRNSTTIGTRSQYFIKRIREIVDTTILGSTNQTAQTKIPFDATTNTLGILKFNNVQVRKFMDNINGLVDKCIVDTRDKPLWKTAIKQYASAMRMLRKSTRLSREEMFAYQKEADYFFRDWIDLHQAEGMTNYIHMMGSGHVLEYLFRWGNLSMHSQQGWEAFNSQFKTYYFSRTQRGGGVNQGKGKQSRMLPMARWLQRRMIFMAGYEESEIQEFLKNLSEDDEKETKNWVRENGGTIEYGQLIQGEGEDTEIGEGEEDLFNWHIGTQQLYGSVQQLSSITHDDDDNDNDENQTGEQNDQTDLDYDSVIQSSDDEQ